jgi:hypothetical protein
MNAFRSESVSDHRKSAIQNPKWTGILALVVIFSLCWAILAEAQQPKKIPRIRYRAAVSPAADAPRKEAFRQSLREFGYIEGQNIFIEYRHEDQSLTVFQSLRRSSFNLRAMFSLQSRPMPLKLRAALARLFRTFSWA